MRRLVTALVLLGFVVCVLAGATKLSGHRKCKPQPLTVQEARHLLKTLPFVTEDRKAGLQVDFVRNTDMNVWYEFMAEHSPAPYPQTSISGFYAVNRYTADVANGVAGPCDLEKGKKLAKLQRALRKAHCLGPAVLKKYRDPDRFPCLE